jgi:transposase, IS5 family
VSLFEPHADIIVKGARDVQYGHKLNLLTGKSGLILDVVIEAGNPAHGVGDSVSVHRQAIGVARIAVGARERVGLCRFKPHSLRSSTFLFPCGLFLQNTNPDKWNGLNA